MTVDNPARRRVAVTLRDALHPALATSAQRTTAVVAAGGRLRWRIPLTPRRRGEHPIGPLTARVLGPWGLALSQRRLLAPTPRRVYPQVRWDGRVGQLLTLAQRHRLGQMPLHVRGHGSEPYALREYLAGDALNRIHWKATARHGRLVSREDTWERGAPLLILLDAARSMASLDGRRSKLDHALATALALTRVAVGRGDTVTFLAFSDRVERSLRVKGSRDVGTAYAQLYDLEARLVEPAYDLAAEAAFGAEGRRATVVVITSVVDLAAAELLKESLLHLERRHRPLLVNLEDPQVHTLAEQPPSSPPEAFAQVAALETLLAGRRLGRRLRRAGVRFVGSRADRLAVETLEAYLEMFQPGRSAGAARSPARDAAGGRR